MSVPLKGPCRIYLYDEPRCPALTTDAVAEFLRSCAGRRAEVVVRGDFWARFPREHEVELAEGWARARVTAPDRPAKVRQPLPGEVEYELRRLVDVGLRAWGILYDGLAVMRLAASQIPPDERTWDNLHVIFTNQLLGTWDANGGRWHARTAVFGFPCLVSTTGLAVAPARSPAWHLLKQVLGTDPAQCGFPADGSYLEVDDLRLGEVAKGMALQCLFYHLTGDPFCRDPGCRLYNAHRQSELLYAQLRPGAGLCAHHHRMLEMWSAGARE
ncbi:MAG: hypothetical protein QME87_02030 [Bacillota bacterium]|nr:hypothetical protein [Bacillota bacterium]